MYSILDLYVIFVVMVWVALDHGSVIVEGRLVGLALQGIPVPSVAGFTSSSCRTSVLSSLGVDVIWFTINSGHSCSFFFFFF